MRDETIGIAGNASICQGFFQHSPLTTRRDFVPRKSTFAKEARFTSWAQISGRAGGQGNRRSRSAEHHTERTHVHSLLRAQIQDRRIRMIRFRRCALRLPEHAEISSGNERSEQRGTLRRVPGRPATSKRSRYFPSELLSARRAAPNNSVEEAGPNKRKFSL